MSYSHVIMKSCSRDIQLSCPLVFMLRLACSVVDINELWPPSASHYLGLLDLSLACSWTLSLALLLFYYLPLPLCNCKPFGAPRRPLACLLACLFVWSCARLLVCSLARLLVCSFARLIACLLARLFACLLSFALLAFFLDCLLGSSKFVPWRLLDSSSRCSGARDSVLDSCLRAPRGVREPETRSLEATGELLEVFGSSNFGS